VTSGLKGASGIPLSRVFKTFWWKITLEGQKRFLVFQKNITGFHASVKNMSFLENLLGF
jgi:hypothetical protein